MSVHRSREERDLDVSLFNDLYCQHHQVLYAYLLGRCSNRDVAADLLQETCLRLWRHIQELRIIPEERRRYWLFAVARNVANDYHRRRGVRERHEAAQPDRDLADGAGDSTSRLEQAESATAVDVAMQRLPEDLRTVMTLRFLAEMTSEEIGQALGRPAGTVRYQIAKARRRLAQELHLVQGITSEESATA